MHETKMLNSTDHPHQYFPIHMSWPYLSFEMKFFSQKYGGSVFDILNDIRFTSLTILMIRYSRWD